jgi:hypothetical protein
MEAYIHTYCRNNYQQIINQKIEKLKLSKLWDELEFLFIPISCLREEDKKYFEQLKQQDSKIIIFEHQDSNFNSEPATLNFIKNRALNFESNKKILYTHTKGTSRDNYLLRRRMMAWSRYMDLNCIYKWKECVEALNNFDTAGGHFTGGQEEYSQQTEDQFQFINDVSTNGKYMDSGIVMASIPHYSGNFWWANSDHLKRLPELTPNNLNYFNRGEFWVCYPRDTKSYNNMNPFVNHYAEYYNKNNDFPDGF